MDALIRKSIIGWGKLIGGAALAMFVPAGTFVFAQAWIYLAMVAAGVASIIWYLWRYDRALLERRMQVGVRAEAESRQKIIIFFMMLAFPLPLLIAGLDHRWGRSALTGAATLAGDAGVAAGIGLVFLTLRVNSFAAATVALAQGHTVVTGGPYGIVRHPMYAGLLAVFVATPPALGSWWGLLGAAPAVAVLGWRLTDEENFLRARLPGYADYCRKVKWRLVPGIW